MSSRLFTQVREKRGLAYAVHSSIEDYLDAGSLSCSAGLGHKNAVPALKVILEQLVDIREHGISPGELSRAKQYISGRLALSMEDSLGLAVFYARQWLLENEIRTIDQTLERINAVDVDQVKQVAQQIIQPQNLNLAAIGPELDEAALKKALHV
jgi:predicted Zn-dependent peptidase